MVSNTHQIRLPAGHHCHTTSPAHPSMLPPTFFQLVFEQSLLIKHTQQIIPPRPLLLYTATLLSLRFLGNDVAFAAFQQIASKRIWLGVGLGDGSCVVGLCGSCGLA
jgi:hypothetical protein